MPISRASKSKLYNLCEPHNYGDYVTNLTLALPQEVIEEMKHHPDIKWTQVAREALVKKAEHLRKLDILSKYLEHKAFSEEDLKWMDENDWHPVDEAQLKKSFVDKMEKISGHKTRKIGSLKDLLE